MTGVILAAGRGGRLREVAGNRPKCLLDISGWTLLERQIHALRACGVDRIAVVAGYQADHVRRAVDGEAGVHIVHNERYATTNSVYSLWLAQRWLGNGCVILNADVLFHEQMLVDLLTARYEDALLVDARGDGYCDEDMKVCIRRGRLTAIAKTLPADQTDAENVGIAKFGPAGARMLIDDAARVIEQGGAGQWLPAAYAELCQRRPLHAVESRGFPWIEIDFPDDYRRACADVAPAIDATSTLGPPVLNDIDADASRSTRCHV